MFGIGTPELVVVLVIILVLFGGKKLPELSRNMGEAIKEFRKGMKEGLADDENKKPVHSDEKDQVPKPPTP